MLRNSLLKIVPVIRTNVTQKASIVSGPPKNSLSLAEKISTSVVGGQNYKASRRMIISSKFPMAAIRASTLQKHHSIGMMCTPFCSTHRLFCQNANGLNKANFHPSRKRFTSNIFQSEPISFLPTLHGNRQLSFQNCVSFYHTLHHWNHLPTVSLKKFNNCWYNFTCRHKSKKSQHDSEDDSDSDDDDNLDEDDFEAPSQFKVQTIHAPSLRIDAILSKALGLSRHRLEEIFFGTGILVNGKKNFKKGGKMGVGDYVDAILEKSEDQIKVKRVKLLKVGSEKTSTDKFILRVRIWKTPFFIDNPDQWKPDS